MKKMMTVLLFALLFLFPARAKADCWYFNQYGEHNYMQTDFAYPTCTEYGYYTITCQACGETHTEYTPPNGHNWVNNGGSPPSCTEDGIRVYICTECNQEMTEPIPAMGHNWVETAMPQPSTCLVEGYRVYECLNCGQTRKEPQPLAEHQWSEVGVMQAPTCTEDGYKLFECLVCGSERNETLPATGHQWVDTGTGQASTCSTQGYRTYRCQTCGAEKTEALPYGEHSYGLWTVTVDATDHSAGTRTRTCSICGQTQTQTFYPKRALYRGGESGQSVVELQQKLIDLGFLTDVADGIFGGMTEQAVISFQQSANLSADGIAWPETLDRLQERWNGVKNPSPTPSPAPTQTPTPTPTAGPTPVPSVAAFTPTEGVSRPESCERTMDSDLRYSVWVCSQEYASILGNEIEAVEELLSAKGSSKKALVEIGTAEGDWQRALDALYVTWGEESLEANTAAIEARNTFYDALARQAEALLTVPGSTDANVEQWKIAQCRNECMRLSSLLGK